MKTKSKQFLFEIDPVRRRLEAWRKSRKPRDRIPEPLWAAMARAAKDCGVSRVSKALHVEYPALKARVVALEKKTSASPALSPPAFVELKALPILPAPTAGVVELEDSSGTKMTLRMEAGSGLDALALVQAFWRRAT
jgi:hypothetical protein